MALPVQVGRGGLLSLVGVLDYSDAVSLLC